MNSPQDIDMKILKEDISKLDNSFIIVMNEEGDKMALGIVNVEDTTAVDMQSSKKGM